MNNFKVTIKDVIYLIIILVLIILVFLSKMDFRFNILDKNNWIDIIMGFISIIPSTILSIILYNFEKKDSKKQKNLEKTIFNKELDSQLREERLKIFSTIMSLGTLNIINVKNYLVTNFLSQKYDLNADKYNEIVIKEKEITDAYCKSKLLFKDDDKILKIMEKCFNLFVEYRQALQQFMSDCYIANQRAIEELKDWDYRILTPYIPKDIIEHPEEFNMCKEIFFEYYKKAESKEEEIRNLISNNNTILAFDKYINISKIGDSKNEIKI